MILFLNNVSFPFRTFQQIYENDRVYLLDFVESANFQTVIRQLISPIFPLTPPGLDIFFFPNSVGESFSVHSWSNRKLYWSYLKRILYPDSKVYILNDLSDTYEAKNIYLVVVWFLSGGGSQQIEIEAAVPSKCNVCTDKMVK